MGVPFGVLRVWEEPEGGVAIMEMDEVDDRPRVSGRRESRLLEGMSVTSLDALEDDMSPAGWKNGNGTFRASSV